MGPAHGRDMGEKRVGHGDTPAAQMFDRALNI